MPLITLENSDLLVEIAPEIGASVVTFALKRGDTLLYLMRPTPPEQVAAGNVSALASFLMAPYSNRIKDARFDFNGQTYQLKPTTTEGHTLHGEVRKRPWLVANREAHFATLLFDTRDFTDLNFPFPFTVLARYVLKDQVFETQVTLTNSGTEAMPAGFGFHPYFNRHLTGPGPVELQANFTSIYPTLIPTQAPLPLPPEKGFANFRPFPQSGVDHCFAGWDGQAILRWPQAHLQLHIEADAALGHVVMYTPPDEASFAFEPVTHANNGFNLMALGVPGHGVRVLNPGQSLNARLRLGVETF